MSYPFAILSERSHGVFLVPRGLLVGPESLSSTRSVWITRRRSVAPFLAAPIALSVAYGCARVEGERSVTSKPPWQCRRLNRFWIGTTTSPCASVALEPSRAMRSLWPSAKGWR